MNEHEVSRRTLIRWVVVVAGAATVAPAGWVAKELLTGGPQFKAFEFAHDETVGIIFDFAANPERYDIAVRRGREIVETFANVDPMKLDELESEYFSVAFHGAPQGAAA